MIKAIAPPQAAIRAFPYVTGVSRRVKAEPTKLSPLSAKIMSASGTFSTRRGIASFPLGRIAGAVAVLSMAVVLALGGDHRPGDAQTQMADARLVQADGFFTLGLGDSLEYPAFEQRSELEVSPPAFANGQDRFEIARLTRLR